MTEAVTGMTVWALATREGDTPMGGGYGVQADGGRWGGEAAPLPLSAPIAAGCL